MNWIENFLLEIFRRIEIVENEHACSWWLVNTAHIIKAKSWLYYLLRLFRIKRHVNVFNCKFCLYRRNLPFYHLFLLFQIWKMSDEKIYAISDLHVDEPENMKWVQQLSDRKYLNDTIIIPGSYYSPKKKSSGNDYSTK